MRNQQSSIQAFRNFRHKSKFLGALLFVVVLSLYSCSKFERFVKESRPIPSYKAPKFPAVEVIISMNMAEREFERANSPLYKNNGTVHWEASAMPQSSMSWLYRNLPRHVLYQLRQK